MIKTIHIHSSTADKMPNSFSKNKRLLTATDYKQVFDQVDIKAHSTHFICLAHIDNQNIESIQPSRLGLAISKAKNKKASERNRIKRLVREYFRLHQDEFSQPLSMVFMTKKGTGHLTNKELELELTQCWRRMQTKLQSLQLKNKQTTTIKTS